MLALFENIRLFVLRVENYSIRTKWPFVSPLIFSRSITVFLWLARQHAGRKKNARGLQKNARGLQRKQGKREVGKPGIECIQKLSYHAVDWFLVSPGLTLRGFRSSYNGRTVGLFFLPFSIGSTQQFLDHLLSLEQERQDHQFFFLVISVHLPVTWIPSWIRSSRSHPVSPSFSPEVLAECVRVGREP